MTRGPAVVRVFVSTYRRPALLERALASLRAQTFEDWSAQVHNDAPGDPDPRSVVEKMGDGRVTLVEHQENLGGTATFNLFFRATSEPFYAVLEDDNWWEPQFLERMVGAAGEEPDLVVLWANMRIWTEGADGVFTDTGRTTWPWPDSQAVRRWAWGSLRQTAGHLHSNSAVLVRSRPGETFGTPDVPIVATEMFRERSFPHPLGLVTEPLANFSVTRTTARSESRAEWAEIVSALAATFLAHGDWSDEQLAAMWDAMRRAKPYAAGALLSATLAGRGLRRARRFARVTDWCRWAASSIRHPSGLWATLRSRRRHPDWWDYLDSRTRQRFAELRSASGGGGLAG